MFKPNLLSASFDTHCHTLHFHAARSYFGLECLNGVLNSHQHRFTWHCSMTWKGIFGAEYLINYYTQILALTSKLQKFCSFWTRPLRAFQSLMTPRWSPCQLLLTYESVTIDLSVDPFGPFGPFCPSLLDVMCILCGHLIWHVLCPPTVSVCPNWIDSMASQQKRVTQRNFNNGGVSKDINNLNKRLASERDRCSVLEPLHQNDILVPFECIDFGLFFILSFDYLDIIFSGNNASNSCGRWFRDVVQ